MEKERTGRRGAFTGIAGAVGVALLVAFVLLATSAGGSNSSYEVRAIFDDAGNLIAGENVAIDGVKVGTVGSVEPTPQAKAAIVLDITNAGFKDFRQDASCTIRPQGLIGEKYVDCSPTQPRIEGTPPPPPLRKIPDGHEGAGQYLLPVTNTHSPVDSDLLNDINRLPEQQRFTLILNELGAGLAGRGSDLNAVIRRANPALQELDKVLAILANEDKVLEELAVNSDKALGPFARVREHVADFIVQSNKVAQASARHTAALAQNLKLFPKFLEELTPSVEKLGRFAEETTSTFTDLHIAAPAISKAFESIPAFSASSEKYLKSLGSTAKVTGPALVAVKPLLKQLKSLGAAGLPFSTNAAELLSSVRGTGGLERLLDFIFLGTGASNGYDALGHFLRTEGTNVACLGYNTVLEQKCNRHFFQNGSPPATAASAHSSGETPNEATQGAVMARTLAVLEGATPEQALARFPGSGAASAAAHASTSGAHGSSRASSAAAAAAAATGGTAAPEGTQADGLLLNYLLGREG